MKKGNPKAIYLKDYTPPVFLVERVDLCFRIDEEACLVEAALYLRRNPAAAPNRDLELDGHGAELVGLKLDGVELGAERYQLGDAGLVVSAVPDAFRLDITTRLKPQDNTALEGLYKSSGNYCTQCEAQGFRRITYFPDRPDVMALFTTRIEADRERYPVLLSNGDCVDSGPLDGGRHYVVWRDPFPKPCYLFALVAGRLAVLEDTYRTASGRDVALRIYTEPHNADKCEHAMDSLKKSMRWDEQRFGLEYDLSTYMIVAVDDFNMGAMENKGLNVFNSKFVLARPDTATDDDYEGIESVIAHEYFHNWTGNRVTCRDWFQLSLKEGLTVFRDQEFSQEVFSPVKRIDDVRMLRTTQFAEDSGPMAHPVRPQSYIEINNFYTVTVYEKGAEVVRMYQTLLGRDGFRKGMDLYFARHDGQAVTTDDFRQAMADATGVDLGLFQRWYDQAGTPVLAVRAEYDAPNRRYRLICAQSCPPTPGQDEKLPLHMPIRMALLGPDGREMPLRLAGEPRASGTEQVLELQAAEQAFVFEDVIEPPVPSLLRGFSAPVRLSFDQSPAELAFLYSHDRDPFNRWDAGQRLAVALMTADMAGRHAECEDMWRSYSAAYGRILADEALDPAFRAEALTLPGETYLAECIEPVDVDAIRRARENLRQRLATRFEQAWQQLYESHAVPGGYRYDAHDAGLRRLRGIAMGFLALLGKPSYLQLALDHFRAADNMTDSLAVLRALLDTPGAARDEVYAAFEQRWRQEPLVLDKWFSLSASSGLPDVLDTVRSLMSHPGFSLRNPNRVRALIGAYAHGNPTGFHRADDAGHAFVADQVLALDRINPQIAARLAKSFSRWKRYDPVRQASMRSQLERMRAEPAVSKDLYEIVTKSLD